MKKIVFFILILFISFQFTFADVITIEATGTGKTLEEAKANARKELAEKVFPGIVITKTSVKNYDNTQDFSSVFSQNTSYSVVGEFPGFDYEIVSSGKNKYVVSTYISGDETTLNFYLTKLIEQKKNVEYFYQQYNSLEKSEFVTKRREALELVVEHYNSYTIYFNIILKLGGNIDVYGLDVPKTLAILQQELQSLYSEEENELLKKSSLESINLEIKEELEKVSKAQEESRKAQEDSAAQARLQRSLMLDQELSEVEELNTIDNSLYLEAGSLVSYDSCKRYIEVIEDAQHSVAEAAKQYDELVENQTKSIEESFSEEAYAIRNRTYPVAHLDSYGNPTEDAKELREHEVSQLRIQKDAEKQEILEIIDSKFCNVIQKRYDYLNATINAFEEKEFYLSASDGLLITSSQYDGSKYTWILTISSEDPIVNYIKEIELSYSDISGEMIPYSKEQRLAFIGSEKYMEAVEKYNKLLLEGKFDFNIRFKTKVTKNGKVTVSFSSFQLEFNEGTKVDIELSQFYIFSLNFESTDYLSYDWLEKKVEDTKQIIENSSFDPIKERNDDKTRFVGLSLNLQGVFTYGKLLNENMKSSFDVALEGRFYIYNFFFSGSANFSFWNVSDLGYKKTILQKGIFVGLGYKITDYLLCSVRASYGKDLGLLINPFVSVSFITLSSVKANVLGELFVNCKTGKTAFSCGLDLSWRVF